MEVRSDYIIKKIKKEGVIIYGAGRVGHLLIQELTKQGIHIKKVWDRNAKDIKDLEMVTPPFDIEEDKDSIIIVCIYSDTVYSEAFHELQAQGYKNILKCTDYRLKELRICKKNNEYDKKQCNLCVFSYGDCQEYLDALRANQKVYIEIPALHLDITSSCTLNCEGCSQYTNLFREKKIKWDYEVTEFLHIWEKVEKIFGWIKVVTLLGGEIFMNPGWESILDICIESKSVGIINIITSGVYHLKDAQYAKMANDKIVVLVDDYSSQLSLNQKKAFDYTVNKLEKLGVNYTITDNSGRDWYDMGDFNMHTCSQVEKEKKFANCFQNQCYKIQPDLYFSICGRQNAGKKLGYIDTLKNDSVDLKEEISIDELREKIRFQLNRKYLDICNYCEGCKNKIPAGKQLIKL